MKQHEAVMQVMENNGGFATLGFLNQETLKISGVEWKTKTPFASIRRIVQDNRFFFKIKPGLWALNTWKNRLPAEMQPSQKPSPLQQVFSHSYYQGLLVEVGNLRNFETIIPAQDKNKIFLGKEKLGDIASQTKMYPFTYPHILQKVNSIDVVWVNKRKIPSCVFEVEHSTDIKNSLIKFIELQDFRTQMTIVADRARKPQFNDTIKLSAFEPIREYVSFMPYDILANEHSHRCALKALEQN